MDDPYKILGVPKNCNDQQLKDSYKKLVIVLHPDKPTGNAQLFKIVTDSFRKISKDIKERASDKQYFELKSSFQQSQQLPKTQNIKLDSKSFDLNKFNKVYEDNRLETATDIGYDDFLRSEKIQKQKEFAPALGSAKKDFNIDGFNQHFSKYANPSKESKHLVRYTEPEPLQLAKQIQYTELGVDNIDDFSADNLSRKNLNYMDLKIAHTTNRIIDPSTVKQRKEYNTIQQLETDRANVSYEMDPEYLKEYQKRKYLEEQKEKQRIQTQINLDRLSKEQFDKVHKLLLGRR
jgi:curved DNA-binding protein CbpA